jgi:hypothetical protein
LLAEGKLWLIDHGASLYFHHSWDNYLARSRNPFPLINDHTLISLASRLREANAALSSHLSPAILSEIIDLIPDAWLGQEDIFAGPGQQREAYLGYLASRLEASAIFVEEAIYAHAKLV